MWRLLRTNRDLRWLFGAQVVSYMGDWFAYVAFVGLVQDIKDLSILVSLVYVAQALPAFLITPISGPVADRYNRRAVIATVQGLQISAQGSLLLQRLHLPLIERQPGYFLLDQATDLLGLSSHRNLIRVFLPDCASPGEPPDTRHPQGIRAEMDAKPMAIAKNGYAGMV